jgi:cytochrome c oxidase subunit 1
MQWLFRGEVDKSHPMTVVASTMVIIVNGLGILGGAVILVMSIVNAYVPELSIDPLLAKNLIYFFGHVFINCTIYMAVMAVYELLPRYTGRAWTVSRPFLWAWVASTVMVLIIYPHHLLMDFVMPHWMLAMGQIIGYTSGLPVFTVTVYGALTNIHRSGMRWSLPSRLIILSMFGWAAGIVPAIIDGTISVNKVMHNTLWVPGHFHFYLLLGVTPMLLALWFHLTRDREPASDSTSDKLGLIVFIIGGLTLVGSFLAAGYAGVPRRFAQHFPEWVAYDQVGSAGAILVITALLLFAVRITSGLLMMRGNLDGSTHHGR